MGSNHGLCYSLVQSADLVGIQLRQASAIGRQPINITVAPRKAKNKIFLNMEDNPI